MSTLLNKTIYASKNGKTVTSLIDKRMKRTIPTHISMEGSLQVLDVQAADSPTGSPLAKGKDGASASGDPDPLPEFVLEANTGIPMGLDGFFYPVIVNVKGAKFDRKISPVIADHDTSLRIGHTIKQVKIPAGKSGNFNGSRREGPFIGAIGVQSSSMGVAQGFMADAKRGFPFQVSIGADIDEAFFLEEGEKAEVNGKTYLGPLIVAEKTTLKEFTIAVLGADSNTSAKVAATPHSPLTKETNRMFEQWLEAMGLVKDDLSDDALSKLKAQWDAKIKATTPDPRSQTVPSPTVSTFDGNGNPVFPVPVGVASIQATPGQSVSVAPVDPTNPGSNGVAAFNPEKLAQQTIEATNNQLAANNLRVSAISVLFAKYPSVEKVPVDGINMTVAQFHAHAISHNVSANDVELTLLKANFSSGNPESGTGPGIHIASQLRDLSQEAIACAVVRQLGVKASKKHKWSGESWGLEHWYDEETLEASNHRDVRNISLHQLMDITCTASGSPYTGRRGTDGHIEATRVALRKIKASASGPTSLDITNIFDDAANKLLLSAYSAVDTTWQEIAATKNVSDFKTHNMYRLVMKGSYKIVGVDGQLDHGEFDDQKYTVAADTYGKIVGLDRRHLINDDLGAFGQIMSMLGSEGAKALEELVYETWMALLGTTYTAGNGNYISGAATDLDIIGLTTLSQTFSDQVIDDAPVLFNADRMLVGTQDRVIAGQLFSQSAVRPVGSTQDERFLDNPHVGAYRPIVTPYLNNTLIKQRVDALSLGSAITGQTANQWFLFADPSSPMGATINVALLNGNRVPFLESADAPFDVLGMRWRAYHDFGVGIGDHRMSAMSKGAA